MLKAVIFDMDGVVVDSDRMLNDVEQDVFKELGISVAMEDHLSWVGMTAPTFWRSVKEKYHLQQSVEELVDLNRKYSLEFFKTCEIEPNDGLVELLNELINRGVKIALASSASAKRISLILGRIKLDDVFSVRVTGDDVVHGKPDPEVFLMAAEKLNVDPKECVVIEDARLGVQAAKSAGMFCVGYDAVVGRQDLTQADLLVKGFGELNAEKLTGYFVD